MSSDATAVVPAAGVPMPPPPASTSAVDVTAAALFHTTHYMYVG